MADEDYEGGEDTGALLSEENVNVAELKLPAFRWDQVPAQSVKTGLEAWSPTLTQRGKLFRYIEGEWKERGLGDVKLLKHVDTGEFRFIMHQERTLKVCANHMVAGEMKLAAGSDKSLTWSTADFADGDAKPEVFLLRFKDAELTNTFKAAWDAAKTANEAVKATGAVSVASPAKGGSASASSSSSAAAAPAPAAVDSSGPVPVTDNLEVLYGATGATDASNRYAALTEAFRSAFGSNPDFYVRAPGRVNLIGEHIDYHGYSVLPMALIQDTVLAVSASNATPAVVSVANTNPKYTRATLPVDATTSVDTSAGVSWHQYVHCGYKGAFDVARAAGRTPTPKSINVCVDGRVPPGAGVSSSSALTVASLLAYTRAYELDLTRAGVGEAARACELYIGTMSGGMDQAISCLANAGSAARIDFEPLKATNVTLPPNAAFVVSNTLEESAKAVDAEKRYNRRVTEGKLAVKLVAKGMGRSDWKGMQTFRQLQEAAGMASPGALLPHISKHLREGAWSIQEVQDIAGFPVEELFEGDGKRTGALKVIASLPREEKTFELLKRARHVCSEAERVFAFQAACEGFTLGADGARSPVLGGTDAQLALMGSLMNASHTSCKDDYECSSPGLDEITTLARKHGAFGSRLTGAGWGGCAVSLVHMSQVGAFMDALKEGYYRPKGLEAQVTIALFSSPPGSGAAIYTPPTSIEI